MSDMRIIAVIALGSHGVEYDGWVEREQWQQGDERLKPLFQPSRAIIALDGEGYEIFHQRRVRLLVAVEEALRTDGPEAAKAVIERYRHETAAPVL